MSHPNHNAWFFLEVIIPVLKQNLDGMSLNLHIVSCNLSNANTMEPCSLSDASMMELCILGDVEHSHKQESAHASHMLWISLSGYLAYLVIHCGCMTLLQVELWESHEAQASKLVQSVVPVSHEVLSAELVQLVEESFHQMGSHRCHHHMYWCFDLWLVLAAARDGVCCISASIHWECKFHMSGHQGVWWWWPLSNHISHVGWVAWTRCHPLTEALVLVSWRGSQPVWSSSLPCAFSLPCGCSEEWEEMPWLGYLIWFFYQRVAELGWAPSLHLGCSWGGGEWGTGLLSLSATSPSPFLQIWWQLLQFHLICCCQVKRWCVWSPIFDRIHWISRKWTGVHHWLWECQGFRGMWSVPSTWWWHSRLLCHA